MVAEIRKSIFFRYPGGVIIGTLGVQNFARNHSISYGFRDKQHFPFLPKLKMAAENRKSLNFSEVLVE